MKEQFFEDPVQMEEFCQEKIDRLGGNYNFETTSQIVLRDLIEKYEDAGYGECFFIHPDVKQVIISELHKLDGIKITLLAYAIMPNHLHLLLKNDKPNLNSIIREFKSTTTIQVNKILNRSGSIWQNDYFDRRIRNGKHYMAVLKYILRNPTKSRVDGYVWKSRLSGVSNHYGDETMTPRVFIHNRGYLRHQETSEQCQFVTIREFDSVPKHLIEKWKAMAMHLIKKQMSNVKD